ncbi:hypothetical protein HAX54_018829 [Datura stramonium]|uniref:Uncharacterized protein n=1 Tax=Datura stramonium TaxID=4076 RepID=A0ABS8UQX7_DATST|nr:hypothetical protein [Datura stramonium]
MVEEPYIDLLGKHPKASSKCPQKDNEENEKSNSRKHRKRKQEQEELLEAQRLFRAKEDLRLEELQASIESHTFITPPPAIEVVPNATMSAPITADATVDVSRATAVYLALPNPQS